MSDLTRKIVDYSYDEQATEAREAFYAAIHDKVMAHLEAQKQSIAKNLIVTPEETQGQEIEVA